MKVNDYEIPEELYYTREHEWVRVADPSRAIVGITDYAAKMLRDIVYVSLPSIGSDVAHMKAFGSVESIKAVSDVYAPLSGRVIKVNERLRASPELANQSPYGEGWLIEVSPTNLEAELNLLLRAEKYGALISELAAKRP